MINLLKKPEFPTIYIWLIAHAWYNLTRFCVGISCKLAPGYKAGSDLGSTVFHREAHDCLSFMMLCYVAEVHSFTGDCKMVIILLFLPHLYAPLFL